MSQPVRVNMATADYTDEGVRLVLTTTAGPTVEFLLDDIALTLLSITMRSAGQAVIARNKGEGVRPRVFQFPKRVQR
jgi:hypothetical protein